MFLYVGLKILVTIFLMGTLVYLYEAALVNNAVNVIVSLNTMTLVSFSQAYLWSISVTAH